MFRLMFCFAVIPLLPIVTAFANPMPGDIFREYKKATGMLRIGERWVWGGNNSGKNFPIPGDVDLKDAIKAEVAVNVVQCHHGTRGLMIGMNDHAYLTVPIPADIPPRQDYYQYWIFSTVQIPLDHLVEGKNQFRMRVEADPKPKGGRKGWMQNLVYGVYLRIYYKKSKLNFSGKIVTPTANVALETGTTISAEVEGKVKQVEFVGYYEGFPQDGWRYSNWQYAFKTLRKPLRIELRGHIGTATEAPYSVAWDHSWIPDQKNPVAIAARIVGEDGIIAMTKAVEGIALSRDYSVEMCKPYDVPQRWVTRMGLKSEKFDVTGKVKKAKEAQFVLTTWCHEGGADFKINGKEVAHIPCSSGRILRKPFNPKILKMGQNILETLATPKGHHGTEVNWPGVAIFVKYKAPYTGWVPRGDVPKSK